jgi:pilus assembly protein CpaF
VPGPFPAEADPSGASDQYVALKVDLHQRLLDKMNLAVVDKLEPDEFRRQIADMIQDELKASSVALNTQERSQLVNDIQDEFLGYGPIEPLLKDSSVSDILINGHGSVFVERRGKLSRTAVKFKDDRHLLRIINKIVSGVGRRIDESSPICDARLPDGSRVNAVIPPVALDGPLVSIRKFSKMPFNMDRLVEIGALTPEMVQVLRCIAQGRLNILISGGTGSGKTTMLNALSSFIDHGERIVTIEDAAELQLQQPHVARMETRPAGLEGRGEIAQRDLVKASLRMRPDRIILGECRGGEALDMLAAMNTGHDGSMTTVHANNCRDAISRVEQMVGMAGVDMPLRTVRHRIASAIHVVLQLSRMSDGKRRVTSVHEITGMEGETVTMQEIFKYVRTGTGSDGTVQGYFCATGIRPHFLEELGARGLGVDPAIFSPDRLLG